MRKMFVIASMCLAILSTIANSTRAQGSKDEPLAEAVPTKIQATAKPTLRPLTVTAGLTDDTKITGTLIDTNSLAVKTAFGEAAIPLSEVAGIRFPSSEDTSTTVVMLNGDSITGATDVKFVSVETTWGSAKINGQAISTMLFVPGLTWQSVDSLGGKRWNLTEAAPAAPATPPRSNIQQARGNVNQGGISNASPQIIYGR